MLRLQTVKANLLVEAVAGLLCSCGYCCRGDGEGGHAIAERAYRGIPGNNAAVALSNVKRWPLASAIRLGGVRLPILLVNGWTCVDQLRVR